LSSIDDVGEFRRDPNSALASIPGHPGSHAQTGLSPKMLLEEGTMRCVESIEKRPELMDEARWPHVGTSNQNSVTVGRGVSVDLSVGLQIAEADPTSMKSASSTGTSVKVP
jgi:hypothetical protein